MGVVYESNCLNSLQKHRVNVIKRTYAYVLSFAYTQALQTTFNPNFFFWQIVNTFVNTLYDTMCLYPLGFV